MHLSLTTQFPVKFYSKSVCLILHSCDQPKPFGIAVDRNLDILIVESSRPMIVIFDHTAYRNGYMKFIQYFQCYINLSSPEDSGMVWRNRKAEKSWEVLMFFRI